MHWFYITPIEISSSFYPLLLLWLGSRQEECNPLNKSYSFFPLQTEEIPKINSDNGRNGISPRLLLLGDPGKLFHVYSFVCFSNPILEDNIHALYSTNKTSKSDLYHYIYNNLFFSLVSRSAAPRGPGDAPAVDGGSDVPARPAERRPWLAPVADDAASKLCRCYAPQGDVHPREGEEESDGVCCCQRRWGWRHGISWLRVRVDSTKHFSTFILYLCVRCWWENFQNYCNCSKFRLAGWQTAISAMVGNIRVHIQVCISLCSLS